MKSLIILFLIILFPIQSTNINGKWGGLLKTEQGDYVMKYNFITQDNKLTGTAETSYGITNIEDGVIKNDSLYFYIIVKNLEIDHACKIYKDSISVWISHEEIGYSFRLNREK